MSDAHADIVVTRQEADGRGRYVTKVNGYEAELTYKLDDTAGGRRIVAKHTGVPDELGGLGVGKALVQRMVEDARAERRLIVPLCSFVRAMLERRKDWQDVRDPAYS
jgi:predicted GNAT family acetyltransferase